MKFKRLPATALGNPLELYNTGRILANIASSHETSTSRNYTNWSKW